MPDTPAATLPARATAPLLGVLSAVIGFALFSMQDALVKWLVADLAVWQVLFARSVTIVVLCLLIGRGTLLARVAASRRKRALLARGAVILLAWLCYYTASRDLTLAKLTTIYFAAPLWVTLLSVVVLREEVRWWRWLGVVCGFTGVLIAVEPGGVGLTVPVVLTLCAAVLWGYASILVRQISAFESSLTQMLFNNLMFVVVCGASLPWLGVIPDATQLLLMLGVGLLGAAAQFTLYEGFRLAPASLIAPFEYSSLVWAFILSWLVWGDLPRTAVWVGAGVIMASGLFVVVSEWWRGGRATRRVPR